MSSTFKRVRVGDVAQVTGGATPKSDHKEFWGGEVAWLTPKDLSDNPARYTSSGKRFLTKAGLNSCSAKMLPKDAVLLTSRAPIGYVSIASAPLCTNQGFKSLQLDDSQDPLFWYYLLTASTAYLESRANGSTFKEVSGSVVKDLEFDVPPLDEQRRIAGVLGALDDLIEVNRGLIRDMDQLLQEQFHVLGLGAAGPASLIDYVSLNPKNEAPASPAPYVDMAALPERGSRIAEVKYRESKGGARFKNGDTLVARITPCLENGKTAYVDVLEDQTVGVGSTEFIVLRERESVPSGWAYCLARSERFRSHAIQQMTGTSGRQRVARESLETFPITSPDAESLVAFASLSVPLLDGIRELSTEIASLESARDELLPLLLSGRVRVGDVAA